MNISNWWGVLYGVIGTLTLFVATTAALAFAMVHKADLADTRTYTGPTPNLEPEPGTDDEADRFLRDLNNHGDAT